MNYTIIKKLPAIEEIIRAFPLSRQAQQKIERDRAEIKAILSGQDSRLLLVVGPCSAWPKEAVLLYAKKLLALEKKVHHALKLVMRVYIQKPRTTKGWIGPVNQPNLFQAPDIAMGIAYARDMMLQVVEMGLPIADEALFPHNAQGFLELLSWVAIGARSTENQEHRIFASALDCAVGLKNPTHGSLAIGINSVIAAQHSHVTVFEQHEVQTKGNPYAHLVLRGANNAPNYSLSHLKEVQCHMEKHHIQHPSVIIDASHDNCWMQGEKDHRLQPAIVLQVMKEIQYRPDMRQLVKGFMLESFIKEGKQNVDIHHPLTIDTGGLSITDPCISWETTETLLLALARENTL